MITVQNGKHQVTRNKAFFKKLKGKESGLEGIEEEDEEEEDEYPRISYNLPLQPQVQQPPIQIPEDTNQPMEHEAPDREAESPTSDQENEADAAPPASPPRVNQAGSPEARPATQVRQRRCQLTFDTPVLPEREQRTRTLPKLLSNFYCSPQKKGK
jgi:hypothetical protein